MTVGAGSARVKICGLTRAADARVADELGADYLGVVLSAGFGRSVPLAAAAAVVAGTEAARVAVLVDEPARAAEKAARLIGASVVQLHGDESPGVARSLRDLGPWHVWRAVRARSLEDVHRAVETWAPVVDGFLVEGWREGVVGGAGLELAVDPVQVRAAIPPPLAFILAGGLTPERVGDAVARFAPDVVDVSSGVEASVGAKDPERIRAFLRAVRPSAARPTSDPSSR